MSEERELSRETGEIEREDLHLPGPRSCLPLYPTSTHISTHLDIWPFRNPFCNRCVCAGTLSALRASGPFVQPAKHDSRPRSTIN